MNPEEMFIGSADWMYRTEREPGLNGRSIAYPRGRVIGGSSAINAMIYMRGQSADYDRWAELTGDPGWRWDAVLPLFKKSEDFYRGASAEHGVGGEWRVEKQRLSWPILDAFRDAAERLRERVKEVLRPLSLAIAHRIVLKPYLSDPLAVRPSKSRFCDGRTYAVLYAAGDFATAFAEVVVRDRLLARTIRLGAVACGLQ